MEIETVPITQLQQDPRNCRTHGKKNLDAIKRSLAEFGQQKPLVVDATGLVVAGNGTLEAAAQLGWVEINIIRTELEGNRARAYAIADNRTTDLSQWDNDSLREVLAELAEDESIDALVTGFDADQIAARLSGGQAEAVAELESKWEVVVECSSEEEQREVYEKLTEEGRKCRVLTF